MKRSDIEAYVYGFLQASSTKGHWTQAELYRYIHDGHMKMFQHVAEIMERFCWAQATMDETIDQTQLFLPPDTYRVLLVERVKAGNGITDVPVFLSKIDVVPDNIDYWKNPSTSTQSVSHREAYYQTGQKSLILINAPTQTQLAAFRVTYIFRPAQMAADGDYPFRQTAQLSDDPDVAANTVDDLREYHDIIALYALEMALLKEESPVMRAIQAKRAEREAELDRFLDRTNVQAPRFMNYTRWDEDDFYF